MKAMILAAGLGTRLRPYTETVPKPLVEVAGRPLIAYPLLQLRAAGVREVVVNVHHLAEQMKAALGDGSRYGLRIHYAEEAELLDTGGGVYHARRWLDDTFVVLNSDSIHDVPLTEVLRFHRSRSGLATIVLRADPEAERYGLLHFDAGARIRRFRGEPAAWPAPLTGMMYAGVCVWEPAIFERLTAGTYSLMRDVVPPLLAADQPVYAWEYGGYWRVVDSPEDLARARREIEGGQRLSYLAGEIS
jgi:NDP-sugar pyrophosphorylase family protein